MLGNTVATGVPAAPSVVLRTPYGSPPGGPAPQPGADTPGPHPLSPEDRADDIALLIARTHALDARHVAAWDLPADPANAAQARRLVAAQLAACALTEASFVTEVVVSELVTTPPVTRPRPSSYG